MILESKTITATGYITEEPAFYGGFRIGTDSVNDPEITVADGDGGDEEPEPTATYDASQLGLNGATEGGNVVYCPDGIHVTITCAGSVEVTVRYRTVEDYVNGACQGRRFGD